MLQVTEFETMSRIGKQPIKIPQNVQIEIEEGNLIMVKGPRGSLNRQVSQNFEIEKRDKQILISPKKTDAQKNKALWGLERTLIANLIKGVSEGFEKKLVIEGVGYRANVEGDKLILSLGFSHPVEIPTPPNITFKVEKNVITVSGIDKYLVSQTAANIRALKKPEPYKGKGIRYQEEIIKRKTGKKAAAA